MPIRIFSAAALFVACALPALAQVPLNIFPSRIVGHPVAEQNGLLANYNPNLVEGRELFTPTGLAIDSSTTPPRIYVSDTGNNRVLGWKDAVNFTNGQPADLVIGQIDFYRTIPQGPGQTFQTGLALPTGLAVYKGDLYVVDSGNNRVLRFPHPFDSTDNTVPDLYIGQPNLASRAINFNGKVAAQGLALTTASGSAYQANIAFDQSGNLWLTDPGNRRVLEFRAADVAAGGGPLTAALEIGQNDFDSVQPGVNANNRTALNLFAVPAAIAFDPASGRLYVTDADTSTFNTQTEFTPNQVGRVLVFQPPFTNGMAASRALGVFITPITDQASADAYTRSSFSDPEGIIVMPDGRIGVVDSRRCRILMFDPFEKWPAVNTSFSPQAIAVIGQQDYNSVGRNAATNNIYIPKPTKSTFNQPSGVALVGGDLYLTDSYNNRVIVGPFNGTGLTASRVLGQDRFDASSPNLIEGREFYFLQIDLLTGSRFAEAGIALDTTSDPPHLYVADTFNHRVLGFNDYRKVQPGARADIVIGQPDMSSGSCNVSGDPNAMTSSTLCFPYGVLVDNSGNLYVADGGNGRVLRFPTPFGAQGDQKADFVLGQNNFNSRITQPGPKFMAQPYGLAFASTGLLVSDVAYNRVLFFPYHAGATTFDNTDIGKSATKVFGQPDFFTTAAGTTDNRFSSPRHIATDIENHLYVADTGNGRVLIFDQVTSTLTPNQDAVATVKLTGLSQPRGIFVNQVSTGEVWVTDSSGGQGATRKYPSYQTLVFNQAPTGVVQSALNPLAVAQDQFGNLVVADASNRIGVYVPQVQAINGANFLGGRALSPGLLTALCSPGTNCSPFTRADMFGTKTEVFNGQYPMPTTLADVQVLFNGQPTPLYYVLPSQISFVVPMSAPGSGTATIEVIQPSTGRILAAGQPTMAAFSPGILTPDFEQTVNQQAAILNADGARNTTTNGAARGTYVTIFGTGQGFVPNAPPDGAAVTQAYSNLVKPNIFIQGNDVMQLNREDTEPQKTDWINYSGLSQFPGVWQINLYIPKAIAPGSQQILSVVLGGIVNYDAQTPGAHRTTIAIKQ